MADRYRNKYRGISLRWQDWDYGRNAAYFVTICTYEREHYFGEVSDGGMVLSEIGEIARKCWYTIPQHFPYAKLDAFVVMPNHIHGAIVIDKPEDGGDAINPGSDMVGQGGDAINPGSDMVGQGGDAINRVATGAENTKYPGGITGSKNPMLHQNLSRMIRWYKGRVTFESRTIHAGFAWQSRFHDHIIRNDRSYHRIKSYIIHNPKKWEGDRFCG